MKYKLEQHIHNNITYITIHQITCTCKTINAKLRKVLTVVSGVETVNQARDSAGNFLLRPKTSIITLIE